MDRIGWKWVIAQEFVNTYHNYLYQVVICVLMSVDSSLRSCKQTKNSNWQPVETDCDRCFAAPNMWKQIWASAISAPPLLACGGCAGGHRSRSPLSRSKHAKTDSGFRLLFVNAMAVPVEMDRDCCFPALNMQKHIVVSAPTLLECGGCAGGNR